ncbi:hypothetical protein Tco_0645954 [Tanacetum coccineum]
MTLINAKVLSDIVSLQCLSSLLNTLLQNTMAEQNVPTQPPTRTDEQIVPRSQWLTIGKSNLLFNAQKIQKNPIFQISVDILSNTNFFQAFTASANVPAIYLQQFWNTMKYNEKTGVYSCQVDEQWFDLSADLLRKALAITPVIPAQPFELPPSGNTVIDFVNELGYPEPVEIVSNIRVNYVYQPWRAILTLINQCLTGKTSGSDKPRHPVLQMLWGIVTQTNVDHAELLWEEFTQGIQTFFSHKASHKASLKDPKKKVTPLLIPYGRFSKVIIYYLASNNNIHRRPDSAVHHTGDDFILGNLKFVPKGETVEVFGMAIPDPLITEAIQQSSYYPKYLEMVAENTKKTPQESASVQPATKHATPKKPTTTTPKGKAYFPTLLRRYEAQQESIPQEEGDDPDLELAKKMSLEAHQEKGEGERPSSQPEDDTSEKVIHESSSTSNSERTESETEVVAPKGDKDQGEVDTSTVTSGVSIPVSDPKIAHEALAGPDPEPMKEDQTGSDSGKLHEALAGPDPEPMKEDQTGSDSGKLHVSLAGPNPEHMDDEFLATAYLKMSHILASSLVTPPINTEATTITTSLPEITPFIALQLRIYKRKHDSDDDEDDDDDEGPSAGSNQGKSAKRRRHDSGASGSAQPPTKDDEQSSKKPREGESNALLQNHPNDIPMQDEGHVSDLEDTDNAHIPKNNWANTYATTYKVPAENKLQRKTYDIGSFIKWFCRQNRKKKLCKADLEMDECHKLLTNKVDLDNPEGHQILRNIYEPLPLGGPPGQCGLSITHWWFRRKEFYINKHSEPSDREVVRLQMRILRELYQKTDHAIDLMDYKVSVRLGLLFPMIRITGGFYPVDNPLVSVEVLRHIRVERWFFTMKMEIMLESHQTSSGYLNDGDGMGSPLQDDVRLMFGDDLKESSRSTVKGQRRR